MLFPAGDKDTAHVKLPSTTGISGTCISSLYKSMPSVSSGKSLHAYSKRAAAISVDIRGMPND